MLTDEKTVAVRHEDAAPGYRYLELEAPALAASLVPGQFVHVRVPGLEESALRRPLSVFDAKGGRVTLLYKKVGRGTEALSRVREGESVMVEGPLGRGFPVECEGRPLLVGGGYGVAPLHFLASRMVEAGRAPVLFAGGRTEGDLLALDKFAELGVEVRAATQDGSFGAEGLVTDPLDDMLIELRRIGEKFALYACGPDGMLRAVAMRATGTRMPGWISMDRHMACGVGACFACIQKVRLPDGTVYNARCCANGPVFRAEELVW